MNANYDYDLFCVNTNANENSDLSKQIFKIVMEKIFPEKSPYEIIDYNLSSFVFDAVKEIKTREDNLEKELKEVTQYKIKLKNNLSQNKNNLYIFFALILVLISKILFNFFYMHFLDIKGKKKFKTFFFLV